MGMEVLKNTAEDGYKKTFYLSIYLTDKHGSQLPAGGMDDKSRGGCYEVMERHQSNPRKS